MYFTCKGKTKILKRLRFISQHTLLLTFCNWPSYAPASLIRLKNMCSGGLQSRSPWLYQVISMYHRFLRKCQSLLWSSEHTRHPLRRHHFMYNISCRLWPTLKMCTDLDYLVHNTIRELLIWDRGLLSRYHPWQPFSGKMDVAHRKTPTDYLINGRVFRIIDSRSINIILYRIKTAFYPGYASPRWRL